MLAQPDQALGVQPTGAVIALTADAGQSFSYQLSREFRLSQNLFARTTQTDDNRIDPTLTDSREAGVEIGIERTFVKPMRWSACAASALRLPPPQ